MELELKKLEAIEFANTNVGETFYCDELAYLRIEDFNFDVGKKEHDLVNALCLEDMSLTRIDDDKLVRVFESKLIEKE